MTPRRLSVTLLLALLGGCEKPPRTEAELMERERELARQQDAALLAMTDRTLGPPELDHAALSPVSVVSRILFDGDLVSFAPSRLLAVDDILVVADRKSDPWLHLVDTATGKRLKSFGPKGDGPGEYRAVPGLSPASHPPRSFWTFSTVRMTQHALDARPSNASPPVTRTIVLQQQFGGSQGPVPLDDATIVVTQVRADASVARFDGEGRFIALLGHYKDWMPELAGAVGARQDGRDANGFEPGAGFNSRRCVSPDGRHFAIPYVYASRVELWDAPSFAMRQARVPFPYNPRIERHPENGKRGFEPGWPNTRIAYISCAATNTHVYAVFLGRLRSGYEQPSALINGRFVHVFDWAGALVRVVQLDHDAEAIAVSADGRSLYSVQWKGEPPDVRSEGRIRQTTLPPL